MSQLALPFEESTCSEPPSSVLAPVSREADSKDDNVLSEEKFVEVVSSGRRSAPTEKSGAHQSLGAQPLSTGAIATWPAGLTWNAALEYTAASPTQFRRWQKSGAVTFRRIGKNGAKVVLRSQLDALLHQLFGEPAPDDIAEDFDFG